MTSTDSQGKATVLVDLFRLNGCTPLSHPDPSVLSLLTRLVDALRDECAIETHGFSWDPEAWKDQLSRRWSYDGRKLADLVAAIDEVADTAGHRIERQHLHALAMAPVLVQFVAVMAWGYGSRGLGWWHLAKVFERNAGNSEGLEPALRKLERIRRLAHDGDPRALATSWLDQSHEARVVYLRAAFASKLAYAATGPDIWSAALIADRWVAWGLWMLTGLWDVRTNAEVYRRYIEIASAWASSCRCQPDEIERALFTLGPRAEAAWGTIAGQRG